MTLIKIVVYLDMKKAVNIFFTLNALVALLAFVLTQSPSTFSHLTDLNHTACYVFCIGVLSTVIYQFGKNILK